MTRFLLIFSCIFWLQSGMASSAETVFSKDSSPDIMRGIEHELKDLDPLLVAQAKKKRKPRKRTARKKKKKSLGGVDLMGKARRLAVAKRYQEASKLLYSLTRSPRYRSEKTKIKYMLGLMLMEMELYQVASFVFFDVIRAESSSSKPTKYLRQSLGKIAFLSNALDSDVLLKHAIAKIQVKDFPVEQKDLFYLRLGELRRGEGRYQQAAKVFSKVDPASPVYPQALYRRGLAWAETRRNDKKAIRAFDELLKISKNRGVTDDNRVNAILAKARVFYQAKKWERAVDMYRNIPRDTWQWHDALFEQSWAMFQSSRQFRSALSNFHTLHSPYYDDVWNPESLQLRAIIYLFICRYDEMEKVLTLYDRVYKPAEKKVRSFIKSSSESAYLNEVLSADKNLKKEREKNTVSWKTRLPKIVLKQILRQPKIRRDLNYVNALSREQQRLKRQSVPWQNSGIGTYASKIVNKRITNTKKDVAKRARIYLRSLASELRKFDEQGEFLKLERVRGKRLSVKKEIVGKNIERKQIAQNEGRSFFIRNGFEYWPYRGEYWLDELGNYHYVGVGACE